MFVDITERTRLPLVIVFALLGLVASCIFYVSNLDAALKVNISEVQELKENYRDLKDDIRHVGDKIDRLHQELVK